MTLGPGRQVDQPEILVCHLASEHGECAAARDERQMPRAASQCQHREGLMGVLVVGGVLKRPASKTALSRFTRTRGHGIGGPKSRHRGNAAH